MTMGDLVLASRNANKLAELSALMQPLGYRLRPVSEFSDAEPDESAPTFIENALIKARHAARVSGLPALADDSGLEVDVLLGAPGVHSARYAGTHGDDAANNAKLLEALTEVSGSRRAARFICVLAFLRHDADPVPIIAQGVWTGSILQAPRGDRGFGYDPLFLDPRSGLSSAELAPEDKNRRSHRARAMQALAALLREA